MCSHPSGPVRPDRGCRRWQHTWRWQHINAAAYHASRARRDADVMAPAPPPSWWTPPTSGTRPRGGRWRQTSAPAQTPGGLSTVADTESARCASDARLQLVFAHRHRQRMAMPNRWRRRSRTRSGCSRRRRCRSGRRRRCNVAAGMRQTAGRTCENASVRASGAVPHHSLGVSEIRFEWLTWSERCFLDRMFPRHGQPT